MDDSSSDELSSDSEVDQIFEATWEKTKASLDNSSESEQVSESEPDDSDSQETNDNKSAVDTECSSLFVIDKDPTAAPSSDIELNADKFDRTVTHGNLKDKKTKRRKFRDDFRRVELSSSLQVNQDPSNIYIQLHSTNVKKSSAKASKERISKEHNEVMKKSIVTPDFERKSAVPMYEESIRSKRKERKKEREKTKGRGWFDMPRGDMTEETKNDLLALKMRRALDPKRFYKSDDVKGLPKYFQFGTVVEDASEFYSSRIPKKKRKKTIVEELMADKEFNNFNKRKYREVQEMKAKGLGPYKGIKTSRMKRRKKK